MARQDIKVFHDGECLWVAASTAVDARRYAIEELQQEETDLDDWQECSEEYLIKRTITDEDGIEPDVTFREELDKLIASGTTFPAMLLETE